MLCDHLARGLVGQQPEAIAYQLALWQHLTLSRVLVSQFRALVRGRRHADLSKLASAIDPHARKQASRPPQEIRADLLETLAEHFDVTLPRRITAAELDEVCAEISRGAIAALRRANKRFEGSTIDDMVRFSLDASFDNFGRRLRDLPEDERNAGVQGLVESIRSMPTDRRQTVLEALGIDEVTAEVIRKAALAGTLGPAFVAVSKVAGFSAYTSAASAVGSAAGTFGLTLPSGVYTTLTSFMSIVASPLVMITMLGALLFRRMRRGDRKLKDCLAPSIVAALMVSPCAESEAMCDPAPLLVELLRRQLKRELDAYSIRFRKPDYEQRVSAYETFELLTSIHGLPAEQRDCFLQEVKELLQDRALDDRRQPLL